MVRLLFVMSVFVGLICWWLLMVGRCVFVV